MTVKELKEKCKERGLKISGTKNELIERLKNPSTDDVSTKNTSKTILVGFKMDDESKKTNLYPLLLKGFAKSSHYSCGKNYYIVDREKWAETVNF